MDAPPPPSAADDLSTYFRLPSIMPPADADALGSIIYHFLRMGLKPGVDRSLMDEVQLPEGTHDPTPHITVICKTEDGKILDPTAAAAVSGGGGGRHHQQHAKPPAKYEVFISLPLGREIDQISSGAELMAYAPGYMSRPTMNVHNTPNHGVRKILRFVYASASVAKHKPMYDSETTTLIKHRNIKVHTDADYEVYGM